MTTSPWTLPPHPGGSTKTAQEGFQVILPAHRSKPIRVWLKAFSSPRGRAPFWSALQIATSGLAGSSKHEQSICFAFLANHICQIWREARGVFAHAQITGYGQKLSFLMLTRKSAFVRGSFSENQGLLAGTMRYSRAKVYNKSCITVMTKTEPLTVRYKIVKNKLHQTSHCSIALN